MQNVLLPYFEHYIEHCLKNTNHVHFFMTTGKHAFTLLKSSRLKLVSGTWGHYIQVASTGTTSQSNLRCGVTRDYHYVRQIYKKCMILSSQYGSKSGVCFQHYVDYMPQSIRQFWRHFKGETLKWTVGVFMQYSNFLSQLQIVTK